MELKVGDRVECNNPGHTSLTRGKTYKVIDVRSGYFLSGNSGVKVVNDKGDACVYYAYRFKKAPDVAYSEWIMANPGVTIPDNAVVAKAEDGSVVCFKVPVKPEWDPSAIWFLPC